MTRPPSPAETEAVTTTMENHDGQEEGLPPGQDGRRQEAQVTAAPRASPARGCCLTCAHSTLRSARDEKSARAVRELARHGFVNCTRSPAAASFRPFDSRCDAFASMPDDAARAREEWARNNERTTCTK